MFVKVKLKRVVMFVILYGLLMYANSHLSDELIRNTADFLDKAMDLSDDITHKWSSGEVVLCCLEASKQVG